jgi:hypothetical protein
MEHEEEKLEQHSDVVGDHIDDARRDWESKQEDPSVPGAQPDEAEDEESVPGVAVDEDTIKDEPGP